MINERFLDLPVRGQGAAAMGVNNIRVRTRKKISRRCSGEAWFGKVHMVSYGLERVDTWLFLGKIPRLMDGLKRS